MMIAFDQGTGANCSERTMKMREEILFNGNTDLDVVNIYMTRPWKLLTIRGVCQP